MDLPVNQFKRAIASGKTLIGAWLMSAAPSTAEALGSVGFDFLVVDMEHTPIDTPQMIGILQASPERRRKRSCAHRGTTW